MGVAKHTYTKMNQDLSKSKYNPEIYFEGKNIRTITNEAFGSITNTKGNTLKATLPNINSNPTNKQGLDKFSYPLNNATILGHTTINEDVYILTKYAIENPFAKLFYAQKESASPAPFIDSNIRITVDGTVIFTNFTDTQGAVEGPNLPTGTNVRIQAFSYDFAPNEVAPAPTLYLEIYKNGELIEKFQESLPYTETITINYDFVVDSNSIYFFQAYSLPTPGPFPNPFTNINIFDYIVNGDIFAIYKMDKNFNLELIFFDDMPVEDDKIDVLGFYENERIQKIYWADKVNELRFLNVVDPNSLNLDKKFLSTVPEVVLTQPEITGFSLGSSSHTSGTIQYAYNLYKTNGAQTKISPLSEIVYLNNGDRGNAIDIKVDKAPKIKLNNLDTSFDRIRIYSIKYNSKDVTPEIKLISEQGVLSTIELIDDNNSNIAPITLSEFTFLGGEIYIPQHIKTKDNHLFLLNYKTREYDIDFDARAYRYDTEGNSKVLSKDGETIITFNKNNIPSIPETFDAINPTNKSTEEDPDWNKYVWKESNETVIPGGPYTFPQLFIQTNNTKFSSLDFFDQDDLNTDENSQNIAYTTQKITTRTEYKIDTSKNNFTITNSSIEGDDNTTVPGLVIEPLCHGINTPGPFEWKVEVPDPLTLILETVYVFDSRCTGPFPTTKAVTLTITEGTVNTEVTFDLRYSNNLSLAEPVFIENFDPNTLETDESTFVSGELGGIGPNVEFDIKYKTVASNIGQPSMLSTPSLATEQITRDMTSLKSGEVYRMFIEFFFNNGKYSFIKWVADIKIPEIGTPASLPPVDGDGNINYCYIETKLLNIPNDIRINGWRTVIVERSDFDKSVVTQGIYNPTISNAVGGDVIHTPSYFQRTIRNNIDYPFTSNEIIKPLSYNKTDTAALNLSNNLNSGSAGIRGEITSKTGEHNISVQHGTFHSPEVVLEKSNLGLGAARIRKLGLLKNTNSQSSREVFNEDDLIDDTLSFTNSVNTGAQIRVNIPNFNIRSGKFITDNKNTTGDILYTKKRHAFVRYFGGYSFVRNTTDNRNNINTSGKINYLPPVVNQFNFINPTDGLTVRFSNEISVPVQVNDDVFSEVLYKAFNGSSLALIGIGELFTNPINITELPLGDQNDYAIACEIYRVVENQYGGDTYEARQLNRAIPYSNVVPLEVGVTTTDHYGDTFIQKFNYLNTFRSGDGIITSAELVSFPVETSINLDLRFDITKNRPENFEADELTSYGFNLAYSQLNNTIKSVSKPTQFDELINYPVSVIPSKQKVVGELIDSFTDFLVNDVKNLDGKYGEITGVGEFRDNLFAFQRNAIAYLAINPRVQVQASDGISIELGTGRLIERYQYTTTTSGTLNKWSIAKTKNGLMYFDLLNKSLNFLGGESDFEVSTVGGLYNKILNYSETNQELLTNDNLVLGRGVLTHYDNNTEDTYISFKTPGSSFTVAYNGLTQGFTSYYDFIPNHAESVNGNYLTMLKDTIYKQNEGDFNTFYGVKYPSSVTIVSNENPDFNKIFDNIHFNSEVFVNGSDIPNVTFNKLRVYTEYQDTGVFTFDPTQYISGIKRRLRKWNLIIPRESGSRNRINNPWAFIQLQFDNPGANFKIVLHDLLVSYTPK